uniref:Uncharacterized protein n=1 Tax=Rhizophora mucronata TaxID=61149 RepID=A0A2P2P7C7_RHIMU
MTKILMFRWFNNACMSNLGIEEHHFYTHANIAQLTKIKRAKNPENNQN